MAQDYDKLVLGNYYSEDYLKQSRTLENSESVGKLYDLVLTVGKSASDPDVLSRNLPSKAITDTSNVYLVVDHESNIQDVAITDQPVSVVTQSPIDVSIQDQTTPALITRFNQVTNSTVLTAPVAQFSYVIEVSSTAGMFEPTGIFDGSFLILFDVASGRFCLAHVVSINGLIVTLDTQVDFAFPAGTIVDVTITNMAVDGSVTPQIFGIRGLGTVPGIETQYDITRIIFTCLSDGPVSLDTFADLPKLLRGLALRHRDGEVYNIFNVKTNREIEGITLDWKPYASTNPQQGQDGFSARLTFSGQDKVGIVQRIGPGEDLEVIIQDDLTDIVFLEIVAEGHEVD